MKLTIGIGILAAALLFTAGCQPRNGAGSITVIENPESAKYDEASIHALVQLDDMRGMDWASDDQIVVERDNPAIALDPDAGSAHPRNLYLRTLSDGSETPLQPGKEHQGYARLSPDRSKLFYKTYDWQSNTGQGFILDMAGRTAVSFTEKDELDLQSGLWVDNHTILYAKIDGEVRVVDTDLQEPEPLYSTGFPFVHNLALLGDRLYYGSWKGQLMSVTLGAGAKAALLRKDAEWMVPSPDEQRLAVVRRLGGGARELVLTDLEGRAVRPIARADAQFFGVAWSPDGTKIAYARISDKGTVLGIDVADTTTGRPSSGKVATLPVDVKFIADTLQWNPSGNRLMVTATVPDTGRGLNRFVTYLVRVRMDSGNG